ncbi:hypothetical protein [Halalkalicoccus sp. NIPERK01]|uniref:hypothetical protein n=1 Tax=Halalkalicoccus sp. NIPERK01 TaxID=3053469 RepID=UPI00256F4066|nr:hypothetical protein [Halalkalicoccus sp. NIPERK01]MDL5362451.1 hypothetical protein [Halalkalicoccus sp. NIPERK01]
MSHPIDGQVVLLAAAKASVAGSRLPDLLERVQTELAPELDEYRRRYELAAEDDDACCFFVSADHWEGVGDAIGLDRREYEAVRRTHEEQLKRLGKREDRREEFETALDLRSAVVIGK